MVRHAAISRVSEIADDAAGTTQYAVYSYLGAGSIVTVAHPAISGGLTLDYGADGSDGFDQFGRLTDQTWTNAAQTSTFDDFTHTYDRASNRLTRDLSLTTGLDEKYTYDELNRLTNTERGTLSGGAITSLTYEQDWTLDELGNWDEFDDDGTVEDREHNAANEIISTDAGANPTHDAAGNMTFDGTLHYTYDAWNRLVEVHDDNSGSPGDLIATYEFDGKNRRIVETIKGTPDEVYNNYYNANWQLLEVRKDGDADPLKQFVWDLRYIDAPVVRFRDANTDGDYADAGDDTLYFTTDTQFNVTAVVDTSGNVVERYAYDAYGRVNVLNGANGTDPDVDGSTVFEWDADADGASDVDNRTLFTGYHYDAETGLYLARNRIYHPTLGRFIQRDPLGYPDGMNAYAGYHAMHGSMDPLGLVVTEYICCTGDEMDQIDAADHIATLYLDFIVSDLKSMSAESIRQSIKQSLESRINRQKGSILEGSARADRDTYTRLLSKHQKLADQLFERNKNMLFLDRFMKILSYANSGYKVHCLSARGKSRWISA